MDKLIARFETLGNRGVCISIVYGPCSDGVPRYSVSGLAADGQRFQSVNFVESFDHAVTVAEEEVQARGWLSH